MKNFIYHRKKAILIVLLFFIFILIMWMVSLKNYLLFHSTIEITAMVIGFSSMLISIKTLEISENHYFNFLGITLGFAMIITLLHTLTYKGAGILTTDPNIPTQLYIFYKYYECLSLIIAFKFIRQRFNLKKVVIWNFIILITFLCIIFFSKLFPACYNEKTGLTFFKIFSEYLFCFVYIAILSLLLNRTIKNTDNKTKLVFLSIVFKLLSSIFFSIYIDVYGLSNFIGHVLNFISYSLFYTALFKGAIIDPYSNLLEKLIIKTKELKVTNKKLIAANLNIEKEYEYVEKLINFLPDGILIIQNEKITYCNRRFLNMFHIINSDILLGKSIFTIVDSSYHNTLSLRLNSSDKNLLLTPVIYELTVNNKSIFAEVCSLYTNYTDTEQLVMAIRDISDKKRAEDMAIKLHQIEEEEDMKNEFFTNISHELKTPINVIYSALQLQSVYIQNPNSISKYNDLMKKNCLRLIRLTNNMIDITKIQSNFFKPMLSVENIVPIIENMSISIVDYLQFKNLKLVFDTEYEELYARFDRNLLERILLNLLSNAIKYGKQDGYIYVNIYIEGINTIAISVKDDGIGMPLESQEKVFLRLQKLDNSLSRDNEGSGVGLFLVKSFTEIQHGTIHFTSKINEGTEFIIRFPRVHEAEEVCATSEESDVSMFKDTIEKIAIEFSDIYT